MWLTTYAIGVTKEEKEEERKNIFSKNNGSKFFKCEETVNPLTGPQSSMNCKHNICAQNH